MKIAIIGGGPGGLYFATLMKLKGSAHEVSLWERNAETDTFGFGVVFSDETRESMRSADPVLADRLSRRFTRWSDIEIHFKGESSSIEAQGFAAISRKELLELMRRRARELGVDVRTSAVAPQVEELAADFDLVIAADGANSEVRTRYADAFQPSLDVRPNKYMWLGTDKALKAFTFFVKETEWGLIQIHAYPHSRDTSTWIVEMTSDVWHNAGFEGTANDVFGPGDSDRKAVEKIREIFADELDGHQLLTNNSKWLNFTTVRTKRWRHSNVVLLGDAAHTAHFSIGFGTKLALEDAVALADRLDRNADLSSALVGYEAARRPIVETTQRAAQASMEWFENIARFKDQNPAQFFPNLLTRSRPYRI